jgi:succinate-acetate transporter protein
MAAVLKLWGMYTAAMLGVTLRQNRTPHLVVSSLTVLFFLLIIEHAMAYGGKTVRRYEGLSRGHFTVEAAFPRVLNEEEGSACPKGTA